MDAVPSFIFVVDYDVRILDYNAAAGNLLGIRRQDLLRQRAGELLHCIHATDAAGGCGRGEFCKTCMVREAVNMAYGGSRCIRRRAKMELVSEGKVTEQYVLITASPFGFDGRKMVLLVLEDISEIAELQRIVPICMSCRKVRDDDQYWTEVEAYFKRHWDLTFTHGFCPDCAKSQRDRLDRELPAPAK